MLAYRLDLRVLAFDVYVWMQGASAPLGKALLVRLALPRKIAGIRTLMKSTVDSICLSEAGPSVSSVGKSEHTDSLLNVDNWCTFPLESLPRENTAFVMSTRIL